MKTSLAWTVLAVLLFGCAEEVQKQMPPPKISVVEATEDEVEIEKDFVGQVYGYIDIPIRARVQGFLEGIHFNEGMPVKKGQLLYTVDSDPFEASLAASQSKLAEAEIELVNASNELNRIAPLAEMKAVSESDHDAAIAAKGAAEAMVDAAEANVRIEQIQLSYCKILSPVDGLIGKTEARVGEFVGKDPNPVILNTVSAIDSIRVEFFITETDYLMLARQFREDRDKESEEESNAYNLKLILSDGTEFEQKGRINFVNRQVDASTGALLVQASFPNDGGLIRPGQFARVRAIVERVDNGVIIPQRCVSEFQGRFSVMTVTDSNTVAQRPVTIVGPYRDYYLIGSGISKGDRLVLEGIQKVKEGMKVEPNVISFKSQFAEQTAGQ